MSDIDYTREGHGYVQGPMNMIVMKTWEGDTGRSLRAESGRERRRTIETQFVKDLRTEFLGSARHRPQMA